MSLKRKIICLQVIEDVALCVQTRNIIVGFQIFYEINYRIRNVDITVELLEPRWTSISTNVI